MDSSDADSLADFDPFETYRQSARFRVQMAELGHPVIGPQSFYKLTPGEIRVYAEGLLQQQQQSQESTAYSGVSGARGANAEGLGYGQHGPSYNVESKKRRDDAALARMNQKLKQQ